MSARAFITGTYRSGTTLIHRLLDGHPGVQAFPVENCILRDLFHYGKLAHPARRRMPRIEAALASQDVGDLIEAIVGHPKTGLPLSATIVLRGSTGDQDVPTDFSMERFGESLRGRLEEARGRGRVSAIDLYEAYEAAYFDAVGDPPRRDALIVNKCPEGGWCVEDYWRAWPEAKIVHMLRDPRATLASHKGDLPRHRFLWRGRLARQAGILNHSFEISARFSDREAFLSVRYEDIVTDTRGTMDEVARFLGLSPHEALLRPSVAGVPWVSNTSSDGRGSGGKQGTAVTTDALERYRTRLAPAEQEWIELECIESLRTGGYPVPASPPAVLRVRIRYFLGQLRSLPAILARAVGRRSRKPVRAE